MCASSRWSSSAGPTSAMRDALVKPIQDTHRVKHLPKACGVQNFDSIVEAQPDSDAPIIKSVTAAGDYGVAVAGSYDSYCDHSNCNRRDRPAYGSKNYCRTRLSQEKPEKTADFVVSPIFDPPENHLFLRSRPTFHGLPGYLSCL